MPRSFFRLSLALASLSIASAVNAHENGLARTPPMGWNSWNQFQCGVSEDLIKASADAMVASGMKDAGYQYVNIDDCWAVKGDKEHTGRDKDGRMVVDPKKFPSGMKALADYVHSKGLKLGIYSDAGSKTCAGYPGSKGFEEIDAQTFADWGIDYLKLDWCNTSGQKQPDTYPLMRDALLKAKRPIVYSICEWGGSKPWEWAGPVGNLWRTTGDIGPSWKSFTEILDYQVGLEFYAGPGHWNDPDMLEVGVGGKLTADENRAHFSLWCTLAAPLLAGNDLRKMNDDIKAVLTNKEVIAIDQDALGIQGAKVFDAGNSEIYAKPLADKSQAIVLFNRADAPAKIRVNWAQVGWPAQTTCAVRDLWQHKDLDPAAGFFEADVPAHGVVMIRATPQAAGPQNLAPVIQIMVNDDQATNRVPNGEFRIRVLPYDPDGHIASVEIFENDKPLKEFKGGRYLLEKQRREPGQYTFTATVTDDSGATAKSAPLALTVTTEVPPAPAKPPRPRNAPATAPATQPTQPRAGVDPSAADHAVLAAPNCPCGG